jgi:hypothetical protein
MTKTYFLSCTLFCFRFSTTDSGEYAYSIGICVPALEDGFYKNAGVVQTKTSDKSKKIVGMITNSNIMAGSKFMLNHNGRGGVV